MKALIPPMRCRSSMLWAALVVLVASASAQQNPRIVTPPPRQAPVRPVQPPPRPVVRQQQGQPSVVRKSQPVNPAVTRQAGTQQQTGNQIYRGNNNPNLRPAAPGGASRVMAGNVTTGGLRMPPNARSVPLPGGGARVVHPDGRQWLVDRNNHVTAFAQNGLQAKFDVNGRPSAVHVNRQGTNLLVARNLHGDRTAFSIRPGNVVVMTYGQNRGYVQRPIPGRMGYFQRTSFENGRQYTRVYRLYRYGGVLYLRYVPGYSYSPAFYQWVSGPWGASAAYPWQQAPWAGYYSNYYTPAASYPSAAFWLTDYVLTANLQSTYQDHQEYGQTPQAEAIPTGNASGAAPLSPETRQAIAQEVQAQVTDEQSAALQSGGAASANGQTPPPVLDPNQRTLVVSQNVDVQQASCVLTAGDVIYRSGDNLVGGKGVTVNVVASKAGDCPVNTSAQIDVATLQEMHNKFQEQVDAGLSTLASSEAQGGLPAGPPANSRPTPEGIAQPDPTAATLIAQQQNDATSAEAAAAQGASAISASM